MYPTTDQYKAAFLQLLENTSTIVKNGLAMMQAHYAAEKHALSPEDLARAIGSDNFEVANSQYGKFSHELCDALQFRPSEVGQDNNTSWTFVLAHYPGPSNHKGQKTWVMRDEVVAALEELQLVRNMQGANPTDDIQSKMPYLDTLAVKEREQMIRARVGQGKFRDNVVSIWKACSVTGCTMFDLLVASHIRPWKDCDYSDAINGANGLLLTPNLDKAFDRGYITFGNDGYIIVSSQLCEAHAIVLGISKAMKLRLDVSDWHRPYLTYHRDNVFRSV